MKGDLRYVYVIARSKKDVSVVSECDECEDGRIVKRGVPLSEAAVLRDSWAKKPEMLCTSCTEKGKEE